MLELITPKKKADAGKEATVVTPALKEHETLQLIEQKHMCAEHKVPCFVLPTGHHYAFTVSDLASWAYLSVGSQFEFINGS